MTGHTATKTYRCVNALNNANVDTRGRKSLILCSHIASSAPLLLCCAALARVQGKKGPLGPRPNAPHRKVYSRRHSASRVQLFPSLRVGRQRRAWWLAGTDRRRALEASHLGCTQAAASRWATLPKYYFPSPTRFEAFLDHPPSLFFWEHLFSSLTSIQFHSIKNTIHHTKQHNALDPPRRCRQALCR